MSAIKEIIGRCEALEDEASDALAKKQSEHATGFWRGQKVTAKSLRRHLADLARGESQNPNPDDFKDRAAAIKWANQSVQMLQDTFFPVADALRELETYLRDTPHHNSLEAAAARKVLAKFDGAKS